MALPPFQNTRLNPNEWPNQQRLEEVINGITENVEGVYRDYPNGTELAELTERVVALEKEQPIVGVVSAAGAVLVGSGFSSTKTGTGAYKITLTTELASVGALVATPVASLTFPFLTEPTKKVFTVGFITSANVQTDTAFSFMIRKT